MSLLSVKELAMRFGGVSALDDVNFELNRGEILGLIGPNGAGKTTLFNCISGVLIPTSGMIRFESRDILRLKPYQRARLGIARTFQNLQLWGTMTVLENLKVPLDALHKRNMLSDALHLPLSIRQEKSSIEKTRAILHVLGLLEYENTLAGDLPVGIQRRVEVARALCLQPKLLLLDEPAAGLDAEETLQFADTLQVIRDRFKLSMLLVDHDMSLVMRACDYIYVLDFGRMLAAGRPEDIRNNPAVIAAYLGEVTSETSETAYDINVGNLKGDGLSARGASAVVSDASTEPLLRVAGLRAGYGGIEVLHGINLEVRKGETVACIGANGAGKTTTLRVISGLVRSMGGKVEFDGQDITYSAPESVVKLGLLHVPQGRGLFPRLTVEDTLRLAAYSGHREADLTPAFETFPVLAQRRNQPVGTLSGGEQQMVAMARAILAKPKLLMVDEMSLGLAPTVVQQLFAWMRGLKELGTAILIVEQFVDSALRIADRAYVFEQGLVSHESSAEELRRDQAVIASSYLGRVDGKRTKRKTEKTLRPQLTEEMIFHLPAELKRSLEEQAVKEGKEPEALVMDFLKGRK